MLLSSQYKVVNIEDSTLLLLNSKYNVANIEEDTTLLLLGNQ